MSNRSWGRPHLNEADAIALTYQIWLLGLVLMVLTVIAYAPAWNGGFIWDDDDYVTKNPLLTAPDGLYRIWFSLDSPSQYFPLVYTMFRIEHALWGLNSSGYHWVNILLHAANAFLVWRLLLRLNIPGAWLAAGIFALHPVQVESVAWITERKNVLMGFFFLLTLLAWTRFVDVRSKERWRFYGLALFLYLLALFSKSTACTLPAALLLILWLLEKRIDRRRLLQIVPFLLLGLGMGLIAVWWERFHQGTRGALFALGPLERLIVASHAVWFYLGKLLWPTNLTFIYPSWTIAPHNPFSYGWLAAGIAFCAMIYFIRPYVGRSVEVAAAFFVATLSPVLGFIMLYTFRYTFVADHYQYLACIGPIALASAGIVQLSESLKLGPRPIWAVSMLICGVLSTLTWRQSASYADIETLWRTTIARNPGCWMAEGNLAGHLLERGEVDEAIVHYEKAVAIWPGHVEAHNNLGNALVRKGATKEAIVHFQKVLEIAPNDIEARNNLGGALLGEGRVDEAITHFERVLAEKPDHAQAHNNLGNALLQKGRIDEAIAHYQRTLELPFEHGGSHYNLGNAFLQNGEIDEAILHYRKALELRPKHANTHNNLGNALRQKGLMTEAISQFQQAAEMEPGSVLIQNNLAWVLATCAQESLRNGPKAVELAERANQLSGGNNPIVLHTLAAASAERGDFSQALATAHRALELADAQGNTSLADSLRQEIALYQTGLPYHEGPK